MHLRRALPLATVAFFLLGDSGEAANPIAGNDLLQIRPGVAFSAIEPRVNDYDPDGGALSIISFTQPAHGALTQNADGTLNYTPSPGYTGGTDTFSYTVQSPGGSTATAQYTVVTDDSFGRDWATFGGDYERTSAYPGALGSALLQQRWQAPGNYNFLAVTTSTVIASGGGGVSAFDARTGALLWTDNRTAGGPSVFGSVVYYQLRNVSLIQAKTVARNARTGALVWETAPGPSDFDYLAPVASAAGIFEGGGNPRGLIGRETSDGALRFAVGLPNQGRAWTGSLGSAGLFTFVAGALRRHDAATGAVDWTLDLNNAASIASGAPVLSGNRSFLVHNLVGGPAKVYALDLDTRATRWEVVNSNGGAKPAVSGGTVFVLSGFNVAALSGTNGQLLRTYQPGFAFVQYDAGPIATADKVIASNLTGTDLWDRQTGTRLQTLSSARDLAVANDVLFLAGSNGNLFAVGAPRGSNQAPVALASQWTVAEEGQQTITLSATDAEGDALSFAITSLPASGTLYQTTDGVTRGAPISAVPAGILDPQRRVIYVGALNVVGSGAGNFNFRVADDFGLSAVATVQVDVTPVNDVPVAVNDLAIIAPGGQLVDFDPTLNDYDVDGDTLTLVSFTQGPRGTVTQQPNGLLSYLPKRSFTSGSDSFTYTIQDASGAQATATVTVTMSDTLGREWLTYGGTTSRSGYQPVFLGSQPLQELWSRSLFTDQSNVFAGQPAVQGGTMLIGYGISDGLQKHLALEASTGVQRWSIQAVGAFPQAPAMESGRVFLPLSGSPNRLEARAAADGALLWTSPIPLGSNAFLAPVADEQGTYAAGTGQLLGFDAAGGALFNATVENPGGWGPTLHQGAVYTLVSGQLRRHDRQNGQVQWTLPLGTTDSGPVVCAGNRAYVVLRPGSAQELVAVDLAGPAVLWRLPGSFSTRFAVAHGRIYAPPNGAGGVQEIAAETGAVLGTFILPGNAFIGHQPVVTNDTVVVCTVGQTFLYDLRTRALRQTLPIGGNLAVAGRAVYVLGDSSRSAVAYGRPTPGNQVPTATPLVQTGQEDTPLVVSLQGQDGDGDPLSFVLSRLPQNGQLYQTVDGVTPTDPILSTPARVTSPQGRVIYVGRPNEFGSNVALFGYRAFDGKDLSPEAVVNLGLAAVNDAPLARDDYRQVVPGEYLSPVREGLNDSDVEDASLTIDSFTQPSLGTVGLNADGSLRYEAPDNVLTGQTQFQYTARDSGGLTSTATVFIEIRAKHGGEWAGFGNGAQRTGYSTALLGTAPLSLRWSSNALSQVSGVAVGGGRVFATADSPTVKSIVALDERTGAQLWRRDFTGSYTSITYPTYRAGVVYFGIMGDTAVPPSVPNPVLALDAATGLTVWRMTSVGSITAMRSLAVTDQGALMPRASALISYDRLTGAQQYSAALTGSHAFWAPAVQPGGTAFSLRSDTLSAHAADGAIQWSVPLGTGFNPTTAVLAEDRALVGSGNSTVGALKAISLATQSVVWTAPSLPGTPAVDRDTVFTSATGGIFARRLSDGQLLGQYSIGFLSGVEQPVVTDELVIVPVGTPVGVLVFDRKTRTQLQNISVVGSTAVADDALFIAGSGVQAYAAAAPVTFSPVSGASSTTPVNVTLTAAGPGTIRYTLDGSAPKLDSPTLASGGSIPVRASGRVRAILVNGASISRIQEAQYTIADSDGDGIPDWWENATFGNLVTADAASDQDGDGWSDRAEFFAGTDPRDATDVLRATVTPVAGGVRVAFFGQSNVQYRLEASLDLQTWTPVTEPIPGAGAVIERTFAFGSEGKRVYRVRVVSL
ncbi:MAG: PQQ-binding-like beta-propeller repeat protein [Verrucomicrobia bacterium]|nr:PQQ-binding-like beta-propeller repeat protein [Verrucomicrobiota bacterium]